jgi:hypothetical protein
VITGVAFWEFWVIATETRVPLIWVVRKERAQEVAALDKNLMETTAVES